MQYIFCAQAVWQSTSWTTRFSNPCKLSRLPCELALIWRQHVPLFLSLVLQTHSMFCPLLYAGGLSSFICRSTSQTIRFSNIRCLSRLPSKSARIWRHCVTLFLSSALNPHPLLCPPLYAGLNPLLCQSSWPYTSTIPWSNILQLFFAHFGFR